MDEPKEKHVECANVKPVTVSLLQSGFWFASSSFLELELFVLRCACKHRLTPLLRRNLFGFSMATCDTVNLGTVPRSEKKKRYIICNQQDVSEIWNGLVLCASKVRDEVFALEGKFCIKNVLNVNNYH